MCLTFCQVWYHGYGAEFNSHCVNCVLLCVLTYFKCQFVTNSLTVTTAIGAALWAAELESKGKTPTAVSQSDANNSTGQQEEIEVQLPERAVNDQKKEL